MRKKGVNTNTISLREAVERMMKHTGMTREQVQRRLLKELKSGNLRATGFRVRRGPGGEQISTGRRDDIPVEFWRGE